MPFILSLLWGGVSKVFGALLTFFTTKPGCYVGIALLLAVSGWYLNHHGYASGVKAEQQQEALRLAKAKAAAAEEGRKLQRTIDDHLIAAADHAGFLRGQAQAKTITLTKEIPKYVPVEVDRAFPVPCGFVRLHDAAALGVYPQALDNPSALADDAACPLKASDLAAVIVENYGIDHEKDAKIVGLQDLARSLKAALEDGCR